MANMLHAVIMAGGLGTRFWPMSLRSKPKQFLNVVGEESLIQSAFGLVQPWIAAERSWVVTNQRFTEETQKHLPLVPDGNILQEPCGRNTAPCVGLAALCIQERDPDAIMLVMSADHVIGPREAYQRDVEKAVSVIESDPDSLVLFGVPPTYPATGFGYIERNQVIREGVFQVAAFREKPEREVAESYLRDGRFFWNCGIFLWRADTILRLIQQHEPEIGAILEQLRPHVGKESWSSAVADLFPQMKSISVDYAVLEHEKKISVVEATFDWDDVGSWQAMTRLLPADSHGNTALGKFVGIDSTGCIIRSSDEHIIATIGIDNCIVVHTPKATLVSRRDDENGIRRLIAELESQGLADFL
ncbi:mannose-1-phosphate guanylyltransferase [Planctomicrobium sp. SH668]|uniref:mannose-1-phosphate guanylyltransferase n=1 Tax=Planctomicrobium sp. SH668 TaxID=3448126 RepID=UPI003F5C52D6